MSQKLTDTIVEHVVHNLGLNEDIVKTSLLDDSFLSNNKINYVDEENVQCEADVWSSQTVIDNSKLDIMCTSLNYESNYNDFIVLTQLQDCPIYVCIGSNCKNEIDDCSIYCQLTSNDWILASPFIQATFLAGMEQLKETSAPFRKNENKILFQKMKDFLQYYWSENER